jgi:sulfite reductase beta subunit-like hemoprotein
MLMCYEVQLEHARVEGVAAMRRRARLALLIHALTEMVERDYERHWSEPLEGLRPAA